MRSNGEVEIENTQIPLSLMWPLRLFMGFTFLYAGVQHLTDPSYFDPSKLGFIGHLAAQYAVGSPVHDFLLGVVVPNAVEFGYTVAVGEALVGVAIIAGFLFRPAALAGLVLNFMFFLSATWTAFPFYFGSDIVFVFCWLTLLLTGPQVSRSVDGLLAARFRSLGWLVAQRKRNIPLTPVIELPKAVSSESGAQLPISNRVKLYPKQVREIDKAFEQIEKQFVLHRETQTTLQLVRALVISLGVDRNDTIRLLNIIQNIMNRRPTEGASTAVGGQLSQ